MTAAERRADVTASRPASSSQQRLWWLQQIQGEAATYTVPVVFALHGKLCLSRLDAALDKIIARHEPLRTALVERNGTLWQEVLKPSPFRCRRVTVGTVPEALGCARLDAREIFNLAEPPLLRGTCYSIGPDQSVLLFVFHHVVCDAWSLGVFYAELSAHYNECAEAPRLTFHYRDYAERERAWLQTPEADEQRQYWQRQFAGRSADLQVATRTVPLKGRTYEGGVKRFSLGPDTVAAIDHLAATAGTTRFVVLLAAFQGLLHRYGMQDHIIVGVPVACRSLPETEALIGPFVNTVAVCADFDNVVTFPELLLRTRNTLADALEHSALPFDHVIGGLPARDHAGSNPLFEAMLVAQNTASNTGLRLNGMRVEELALHLGTAKFLLTCSVTLQPNCIDGELEYSSECFDGAWASRFVESFQQLLCSAARGEHPRVTEIRLVSDSEAAALVSARRTGLCTYSVERPLHACFERQARRAPDAIAIETASGAVRYDRLNTAANGLARRLRARGAGAEIMVGIYLERSALLITAIIGTLKSGAAFVPLDPALPVARIRQIAEDAGLLLIVTDAARQPQLCRLDVPLLIVGGSEPDVDSEDLEVAVQPSSLAYMYYTSGSTGKPKGVAIEHSCAMNRLQWLRSRYPIGPGEAVLHKTPLIFDVAVWEIFLPLMGGGTILLAEPGAQADADYLQSLLRERPVKMVHFIPSLLEAYLQNAAPADYQSLRWVVLSGEAVPADLPRQFENHFKAELHNQYGQTETSEVAVWESTAARAGPAVPIGKQVGVYSVWILDPASGVVPPGVPGELCVAGLDGLARGYHKLPALTAEKFVPHPYATVPGERLYRTGDIARCAEDGSLEFVGRSDQQIKIRGCRVEPEEVEGMLARHPDVAGVVVVARPDDAHVEQLVAYVVAARADVDSLAAYAETRLPAYMLPAVYVFLDEFPRTASGKIDRRRLRNPCASDFVARSGSEEPRTPLESELCAYWAQLLKLPHVGRRDSFIALGGNSLKSVQVLSNIRETFGVSVGAREFMQSPTVAALADAIERELQKHLESLSDTQIAEMLTIECPTSTDSSF
jgi:amino acid adenylation domain-containing protein